VKDKCNIDVIYFVNSLCCELMDIWVIKVRTRLCMDDLWNTLLNAFEETSNQEAYKSMIQDYKD